MNIDYITEDFAEPLVMPNNVGSYTWINAESVAKSMKRTIPEMVTGLIKEQTALKQFDPWVVRYRSGVPTIELSDLQNDSLTRSLKRFYHNKVKCSICGQITLMIKQPASQECDATCARCGFW